MYMWFWPFLLNDDLCACWTNCYLESHLVKLERPYIMRSPNFHFRRIRKKMCRGCWCFFFFFFVALSSGKHADGWTLLSLSYLFISPNWTNPITAQAIFLLSEKSWHVGVHRILINGSLWGCGLGLTLSQIFSKPWSDT